MIQLKQAHTDFLQGFFATHDRSVKTKAAYASDLVQFQRFAGSEINLTQVSSTLIEGWAAQLKRDGYSPASIRRKAVVLKVFFSYWVRKKIVPESPFWRVKLSFGRIEQLPRALTEQEMRALLVHAGRKNQDISKGPLKSGHLPSLAEYRAIRNLALVDILFATGIRVGEASALDVADFVVHEAMFRIQGKGGRDRVAFTVDENSFRIQRDHLDARLQTNTTTAALFLNSFGGRLSTQGISNVISQIRRDAGIGRHVTPHMLRHTVATLLLRNGVDIRVVQEFLGHSSIATTQRYTHISKEHLIEVLRKSHPSMNLRSTATTITGTAQALHSAMPVA